MTDVFSKKKRSEVMACIKSKNTMPELVIRKALFANGFRFRVHNKKLPGMPDIVLPKYKAVIFINGCFWHGHKNCKYFRLPMTRTSFWKNKIESNRARDKRNARALRYMNWKVFTLWECKIKNTYADPARSVIRKLLRIKK